MRKTFLYIGLIAASVLMGSNNVYAQTTYTPARTTAPRPANATAATPSPKKDSVVLNLEKNKLEGKKPIDIPDFQNSDEHWSMLIYRMVNLKEEPNVVLALPDPPTKTRKNLITLLLEGIDAGLFNAYNPDLGPGKEFEELLTPEALNIKMGAATRLIDVLDENGNVIQQTDKRERQTSEVTSLMIMEYWWFDRKLSELKVRILGLCPIREYEKMMTPADASLMDEELSESDMLKAQAFWVYYPHVREVLAKNPVYSYGNNAKQISFDDIFLLRRFSSYIYADRASLESGKLNNLNEAERKARSEKLQEAIFNMEQDMWEN